jgi:hypothetical protein
MFGTRYPVTRDNRINVDVFKQAAVAHPNSKASADFPGGFYCKISRPTDKVCMRKRAKRGEPYRQFRPPNGTTKYLALPGASKFTDSLIKKIPDSSTKQDIVFFLKMQSIIGGLTSFRKIASLVSD